jgi:hypothetical protein
MLVHWEKKKLNSSPGLGTIAVNTKDRWPTIRNLPHVHGQIMAVGAAGQQRRGVHGTKAARGVPARRDARPPPILCCAACWVRLALLLPTLCPARMRCDAIAWTGPWACMWHMAQHGSQAWALFRCTLKVRFFSLSPSHQSLDPCMK